MVLKIYYHRLIGLIRFIYVQRVIGFRPPDDTPLMPAADAERFMSEISRASHYVE